MQIEDYTPAHKDHVLQALMELQRHEHALSDTRKAASPALCEAYFSDMLEKGKIFVCLNEERRFAGFISYRIETDDTLLEQEDSKNYALISDICVLPAFRKQGISGLLLDAVHDDLVARKFSGRLRICSLANNALAMSAYESNGFKPYEIIYEKRIAAKK